MSMKRIAFATLAAAPTRSVRTMPDDSPPAPAPSISERSPVALWPDW